MLACCAIRPGVWDTGTTVHLRVPYIVPRTTAWVGLPLTENAVHIRCSSIGPVSTTYLLISLLGNVASAGNRPLAMLPRPEEGHHSNIAVSYYICAALESWRLGSSSCSP